MKTSAHVAAGFWLGLTFALLVLLVDDSLRMRRLALACIASAIVGQLLPDVLEPGGHGNWLHRSLAHAWFVGLPISLCLGTVALFIASLLGFWELVALTSFCFGFAMHMAMDATTPAGLPWFIGNSLLGLFIPVVYAKPILLALNLLILSYAVTKTIAKIAPIVERRGRLVAAVAFSAPFWLSIAMLAVAGFVMASHMSPGPAALVQISSGLLLLLVPILVAVAVPLVSTAYTAWRAGRAVKSMAKTGWSRIARRFQRLPRDAV